MVKQNSPTLAELRHRQGLTQRQVADGMGVTIKAVSGWETGKAEPHLTPYRMLRMMEMYGCSTIQELAAAVAASLDAAK